MRSNIYPKWLYLQRVFAATACVALAPLFLLMYASVRLTSKGPFLFRQARRGVNGLPFEILKVRTLAVNSENSTRLGTSNTSPHATRVGKLLRALKLDELPQLWNVARGDMAFVGPRPIPEALYQHLSEQIAGFEIRHSIRPGLTNLAQVSLADNSLDERLVADWSERFQAELHYIRHRSVGYDLLIIGMTVLFIVRRTIGLITKKQEVGSGHPSAYATRVLQTYICNLDYRGVLRKISKCVESAEREYVCICPVHSVVTAVWSRRHREALRGAALCTADGMPIVWLQKLMGHPRASRVYGPTLMLHVLAAAERRGWRVACYGGHEDRLADMTRNLLSRYPRLQLVESISPPYRELTQQEDNAMVSRLNAAQADIILVGLGCPKQERWMAEHSPRVRGVMLGVGAAFDFHAGAVRQAPSSLQSLGMEWAFRLAMEPRRLWKRYASTNPVYLALAGWQLIQHHLMRRRFTLTEDQYLVERGVK